MKRFADVFKIYRLGKLTVVGFPGEDLPDYELDEAAIEKALTELPEIPA